jgi:hypothetical protein
MIIKTVGTASLDLVHKEFETLTGFDKPIAYIFSRSLKVNIAVPNPVKGVGVYSTGRRAAQVFSKMIEYRRYRSGE